ncbi:MAG: helix-turn-helix transcriptional regulator [bacterium]|nr:helix-turn-helix transcriptional regulator [bacterium]
MATSLGDKIKALFEKRRNTVDARAADLVAEELSLRDLRKARAKTQIALAKELGVGQAGISRIEKRSDLMLSTLRGYVEAMGGELLLVVEFPDRQPVHLKGLTAMDKTNKATGLAPAGKSSKT